MMTLGQGIALAGMWVGAGIVVHAQIARGDGWISGFVFFWFAAVATMRAMA